MTQVIEGSMVHYVLDSGPNTGEHRPALIVKVWSEDCVNLQVFLDGSNDFPGSMRMTAWETSVMRDDTGDMLGSWHPSEVAIQAIG